MCEPPRPTHRQAARHQRSLADATVIPTSTCLNTTTIHFIENRFFVTANSQLSVPLDCRKLNV